METNKPELDAIALKRRIQAEIYAETRHLTPREKLVYFKEQVENGPFQKMLPTADNSPTENIIVSEHQS